MKYRISELMGGYEDDRIDLADKHITTAGRIRELTMERIQPAVTPIRRGKKLGRTLLIAAALTLALIASALAVYQYGLKDAEMEIVDLSPFEEQTAEPAYKSDLSFNGFQDSPEYQAYVEWQNWNQSWTVENWGIYDELGVDDSYYETPENYAHLYDAYFQEQADKLDEIMEKYGLTPHTSRIDFSTEEQLCRALGLEDIFSDEINIRGEYFYDDGSFKAVGTTVIDGEEIWIVCFHAVQGSFSLIFSAMPEDYEQWSYVTASGIEVVLAAAAEKQSFMLAGLDGSYVVVTFSAGLEREQAEALADSVDLAGLNDCFAAEKDRKAVAASVAAYAENGLGIAETDNMDDGAEMVMAILGDYYLSDMPEGYDLHYTCCELPEAGGDGCYCITHLYTGRDGEIVLSFRSLRDGETALEFTSPLEQDMRGIQETACTVNGYDGILTANSQGMESSVQWLDEDRDMVFNVLFEEGEVTALAESVTAEDPELETGAEAYAARAAQYQDEIDALTAQSRAEEEAYLEAEDEIFTLLGDYYIAGLPADYVYVSSFADPDRKVMDIILDDDGTMGEAYFHYVSKSYANDAAGCSLTYMRVWSDKAKTDCINEEVFPEELGQLRVNGYDAYTRFIEGGASIIWLDTEHDLLFELSSVGAEITEQELIALAESVAEP